MENQVFIQKIEIKNIRHLHNLGISLSNDQRKHLILTGKNGSGKTSVLQCVRDFLKTIQNQRANIFSKLENQAKSVIYWKKQIEELKKTIKNEASKKITEPQIFQFEQKIEASINYQNQFNTQYKINEINLEIDLINCARLYEKGEFVLAYFGAKRAPNYTQNTTIEKVNLKEKYTFEEEIHNLFLKYMVSLKSDRLFAKDENDTETVAKIDEWFLRFEKCLKEMFEDESLVLEFDWKNRNFFIVTQNREKIDFNMLSDGYSAILNIITEIMLRMENKAHNFYDMQGIVLIDEIETHLHISLQRKILPFLTTFFPKIQFIVTTHAPLVLSSVSNAVLYDLETHFCTDDLSDLSYNAVIEYYFQMPKNYSLEMENKMQEFEELTTKIPQLSETEMEKVVALEIELSQLSGMLSADMRRRFRVGREKMFQEK